MNAEECEACPERLADLEPKSSATIQRPSDPWRWSRRWSWPWGLKIPGKLCRRCEINLTIGPGHLRCYPRISTSAPPVPWSRPIERSLLPLVQSCKRKDLFNVAQARGKSSIAQARGNRIARSLENMLNDLLIVGQSMCGAAQGLQ